MSHPHHHQALRRRRTARRAKKTASGRGLALLDKAIIVLGLLNTVATLPQVLQIWIGRDASGVSLFSWAYYVVFAVLLLIYGIAHREKPIIVTYSGGVVCYSLIVVGIVLYS
ncbi:hypothetical protein JNJ66_01395 [Candidatus Saccharibacteria bacterium]|nr:hypothetical protein [Candidatus Saccharibacteria bacterium]